MEDFPLQTKHAEKILLYFNVEDGKDGDVLVLWVSGISIICKTNFADIIKGGVIFNLYSNLNFSIGICNQNMS